jgi:hypothetical protein
MKATPNALANPAHAVKKRVDQKPNRKSDLLDGQPFYLDEWQVGSTLKIPSKFSARRRDAVLKASVARYHELEAADATGRLLNALIEGLSNGAMLSMQNFAETESVKVRAEESKNASRAARAIRDLIETRDKRRGSSKQRSSVTRPNVEVRSDPFRGIYDAVDAIRRRLGGTNPLPIEEQSPAEILASLPENVYRAFFRSFIPGPAEEPDVT